MTGEKRDEARADRDHDRSAEARWQVAEAGAEGEERFEAADPSDEREDDSESEGGALSREPKRRSGTKSSNPDPPNDG